MINVYDFEVFKYDWLVVINNPVNKTEITIINDKQCLEEYYKKHKNDIWVGYNSRGYDQWILKGILCGFNPYNISKFIIEDRRKGWEYSNLLNKIQLYNYDVFSGYHGLKTLEGFMGNNIKETSVPFNLDRKLNSEEIAETVKYCKHDVKQTLEVFIKRKGDFDTQLAMIKQFGLPLKSIGKTQAQLIGTILNARRVDGRMDEFDIRLPNTLKLGKYSWIGEWYLTAKERAMKDYDFLDLNNYEDIKKEFYGQILETEIAGVPHTFAWGGVHGALPQYEYHCKDDEYLIMSDVASLYPSLMIQYNLHSRNIADPKKFIEIYNTNLEMKANKNPLRPVYKLICNTTYGCMGDIYNPLYDKLHQNLVCVFGQMLLLDLIEKCENIPSFKLIQSNTDGILVLIKKKDFELFDTIVKEWEKRTRLSMEYSYFKSIFQKDVNNYVAVKTSGSFKTKGAYVKKLTELDYDLPIINKAMVEYMVNNVPVEKTIDECKTLKEFQKIVKISSNYYCGWHNNRFLTDKTFRVFASKSHQDTYIGKVKEIGATIEKFANTPDHCLIINEDINEMKIPLMLDKQWYVDLTKERLTQFGVI